MFLAVLFAALMGAAMGLRVHLLTIPAHGHYMTLRDVGVALMKQGHDVTFILCEGNRELFVKDGLADLGMRFLSAGNCSLYYEGYDGVMKALLEKEDLDTVGAVLDGVAGLSRQMCEAVFPVYAAANRIAVDGRSLLPDVIVFDADTFCAQDLSIAFKIPRVARVGTGPRDTYQNPVSVPQYGTNLPLRMTTLQRFHNAFSLLLSRWLIGPMVLKRLAAKDRFSDNYARLALAEPSEESFAKAIDVLASGKDASKVVRVPAARQPVTAEAEAFHLERFNPEVPWDGAPVLYNSHWGLEHARPLHPHEHMIGHTTDFSKEEARPIEGHLKRWLESAAAGGDGNGAVPVVYVGMGTLSILPEATLKALSAAMQRSTVARFVWVVPDNQQALLPKDLVDYSKRWSTSTANDTMPPMKAGDVLLASWVPQLAVLKHENVKAFWSHGGMNGVAEGTYARSPFLCTPLFSDQPDNCQHIQDRGMGLRLNTAEVKPSSVERALSDLLTRRAHYQAGLEVAWRANVGAGGITRAIQVIEMAASLGYEGSRAMFVPRVLQRREADGTAKSDVQYLVEKYDIDVIAGVVLAVVVFRQLFKACCGCCRCCSRCCCRRKTEQPKAKQVKTE